MPWARGGVSANLFWWSGFAIDDSCFQWAQRTDVKSVTWFLRWMKSGRATSERRRASKVKSSRPDGHDNCETGRWRDALDDLRNPARSLVAGDCFFLHAGRIHPLAAGDCVGGATHTTDLWTQAGTLTELYERNRQ